MAMGQASQAGAQSLDYNVQQSTEDREKPSTYKVYFIWIDLFSHQNIIYVVTLNVYMVFKQQF